MQLSKRRTHHMRRQMRHVDQAGIDRRPVKGLAVGAKQGARGGEGQAGHQGRGLKLAPKGAVLEGGEEVF